MIRDLKLALTLLTQGAQLIRGHLPARYYPSVRGNLDQVIEALRQHIARFVQASPPPP